jgi:hypothetical protein
MAAQESKREKLTGQNVGPGDQTVGEILQQGTAILDYYAQSPSTQLNVVFLPSDSSSTGSVQIDFGPQQPLNVGYQLFTFNQTLQMTIINNAGITKYGWIAMN